MLNVRIPIKKKRDNISLTKEYFCEQIEYYIYLIYEKELVNKLPDFKKGNDFCYE